MLHQLKPADGATKKRKRVGRGPGSGHGKTACRGEKGQKSRKGYSRARGFEGGQNPLKRRLPKRGFHNIFGTTYAQVNLRQLSGFAAGTEVTPQSLLESGILSRVRDGVKVLASGELKVALIVRANAFSAAAKSKIEKAGGKAEVLGQ